MKILSVEQIREADRYTIENEPIESVDLMERAATKDLKEFLFHLSRRKRAIFKEYFFRNKCRRNRWYCRQNR